MTEIEMSCTDCGRESVADYETEVIGREEKARLCPDCLAHRVRLGEDLDEMGPNNLKAYDSRLSIDWTISPADLTYVAPGDMEVDFARRSFERIRTALNLLVSTGVIKGWTHDTTKQRRVAL